MQKHLKTYTTSSCLGYETVDGTNDRQYEKPRNKEAQEEATVVTGGFKMLAQNPENPECYTCKTTTGYRLRKVLRGTQACTSR